MKSSTASEPTLLDQLRKLVNESQLTKGELAKRSGISRKTLFNILGADQDFRVSSLLALADVLKLNICLVPRETKELKISEPAARPLSSHSRVAQIIAATEKDDKWK